MNSQYITLDDVDDVEFVLFNEMTGEIRTLSLSSFTGPTASGSSYEYNYTITGLSNGEYGVFEVPPVPAHCDFDCNQIQYGSSCGSTKVLTAGENSMEFVNTYSEQDYSFKISKYNYCILPDDTDLINEVGDISFNLYIDRGDGNGIQDYVDYSLLNDFTEDSLSSSFYYYYINDIRIESNPNALIYLSESGAAVDGYGLTISVTDPNSGSTITPEWNSDYGCYMYRLGRAFDLNKQRVVINNNYSELGSLVITKKAEGDLTTSNLSGVAFTVTGSDGSSVGTYTIGSAQFPYDSTNDCYRLEITGLDPNLTYTVAESSYEVTGYSVDSQYAVDGGSSVSGHLATNVSLTGGAATTVSFISSYTINSDPTTPSESSESSETAESSAESSAETTVETTAVTTTESASDETTVTSASSTDGGSSGGETATVETTAASETSQTVQSVETTVPTETSVSTGSDTDVDSGNRGGDSDSSVPDTGESTSLSVYIGLGMIVASLPVLGESIRLKRIKRRRSYRR